MKKTSSKEKKPKNGKYVPFIDNHYNLVALVFFAHSALSKAKETQLQEIGITYVEFQVLWAVEGLEDAATPAELSRVLLRRPPTMSSLLNRMEKNGLTKRIKDPSNKKLRKVVMTEKGRKALKLAMEDDIIHMIMEAMPDKDRNQLENLLDKLRATARSITKKMKASKEHGSSFGHL